MSNLLSDLIVSLQRSLEGLKHGKEGRDIYRSLHDPQELPDKQLYAQASQAVDLLYEIQQLLEPSTLILADHFLGYVKAKCLCTAVELDVPGLLQGGPKDIDQIAAASGARPDRLGRVLRLLVTHGIFAFDGNTGCFSNNRSSTLLLKDHWTQWHNWVDLYGNQFYDIARGIPASCKAGSTRNAAQHEFGTDKDMFTYFSERGWVSQFHKTLSGGATAMAPGILADYPWEELEGLTFLDVGGGSGGLVALVLRGHPSMRAGILDLPQVIAQASTNFHTPDGIYADLGPRVDAGQLIAGDFMESVPSFDVYTLKWCLHDWNDSKATKVLTNIRRAIREGPKARVIILESILADGRIGHLTGYADINVMTAAHSGQERDEHQWRALARNTGWELRKIYPLRNSWPWAIELVPAVRLGTCADGSREGTEHMNDDSHIHGSHDGTDRMNNDIHSHDANAHTEVEARFPSPPEGVPIASEVLFLEPWDHAAKGGNPFIRSAPAPGYERTNINWVSRPIQLRDARPFMPEFDLNIHGFAYRRDTAPLAPETVEALRENDKEHVAAAYYPVVVDLLRRETGASRVIIFDHTVRRRNPTRDKSYNAAGQEQPAVMVHCDQSAAAARKRLEQNLDPGEDVDQLLARYRVQMINVWRPLMDGPVEDWPLATMDCRSLQAHEIHDVDLWSGEFDNHRQTMAFEESPQQAWWYLHGHAADELTLIKIWDSRPGEGAKLCAHSAFKHPNTPADALPRQSVEVRCFVLLDP